MLPTSMGARFAGIVLLFLTTHGRLVSGRALLLHNNDSSMCHEVRACRQHVFSQIQCQVAQLNMSALKLFDVYLERQGPPFTDHPETFCAADHAFPLFVNWTSEKKEKLISLYKIFVYFNASLGNITRDQEHLSEDKDKEKLLKLLENTTKVTRGLLANLTCLLCSEYKVHHVDVTYGSSSSQDIFQKKKEGCQVLKRYTKVIAHAARAFGRCHRQT